MVRQTLITGRLNMTACVVRLSLVEVEQTHLNLAKLNIFKSHSSVGTNDIVTMDFSPLKEATTNNKFRRNESYCNNMNRAYGSLGMQDLL